MSTLLCRLRAYGWVQEENHFHLYLDTNCAGITIRKDLTAWGLEGNKSYSLSELTEQYPIEYLAYMMKEGEPEWFNIPQSALDEALKYLAEFKDKKKKSRNLISTMLAMLSSQSKDICSKDRRSALIFIGESILKYLLSNNLPINKNRIYDTSMSIYLNFVPSSIPHYLYSVFEKET